MLRPEPPLPPENQDRESGAFSRLRLVIVEDHDFQRLALWKMLASLGAHDVQAYADGPSALQAIRAASPPIDVVLTDLMMPGMDGLELIRHLGSIRQDISIVMASAADADILGSVESMARAYGVTLLGGLAKPITPGALRALLLRHSPGASRRTPEDAAPGPTAGEIAAGLRQGEFEPFFQPQLELSTGRPSGMEALARWRRPDGSVLPPGSFLQTLEDAGLSEELTWQILERSMAVCEDWARQGIQTRVAVNTSPMALQDTGFAGRLLALVRAHGLDAHRFVIEITESAAVHEHSAPVLENLSRLRLQGFGLSIDDYGVGYSSLKQLSRAAFTELKIDRSFVAEAPSRPATMVMLRATLRMARELGMSTVGEGVETQMELDMLRDIGCDHAQGYFIARPMPAGAVPGWLAARARR
jgi:EAL domain-containing protein (putative c-di-GMP-specific phosphodiesterase class I)/ActR/RegA family two-component response regulator